MLQVLHAGENYGMGNAAVTNAPECFAIHAGSITIYPLPYPYVSGQRVNPIIMSAQTSHFCSSASEYH